MVARRRRGPATSAPLITAAAVLVATVGDVAFDPAHRHLPLCPFHAATGWWCPLCGGLRSAAALAHGRVSVALHDNLLFVAALPLLALYWLDWLSRSRTGQPPRRLSRSVRLSVVAVAVLFTVVRNLPWTRALRP